MRADVTNPAWSTASLLEVADLIRGVSYKRDEARGEPGPGLVPVLRANNINDAALNFGDLVYVPERRVSHEQRIRRGDIVMAMSSGSRDVVGKAALARDDWPGGFGAFCGVLRARPGIDPRYLATYLQSADYRWQIDSIATGTNINNLSKKTLRTIELPVAPQEIQVTLSALLDAVEVKRSDAATHLVAAKRAVDRFRQAVLAVACSGALTADWRGVEGPTPVDVCGEIDALQIAPARLRRGVDPSLPPSDLNGLELPEGWGRLTVAGLLASGALIDVKDGNHGAKHPKVSEFTLEGLPFITANCVRDRRIDYASAPKVSGQVLERLNVGFSKPDDVVLTHKGTVGRVAVATRPAVLTPQTTYYRCAVEALDPHFLAIFMESLYFYAQLAHGMSQTTRDFVPISRQYELTVVIPPRVEQTEIVRRVDQLFASANLEQRIEAASKCVERSSQAVLAKAFRGELVMAHGGGIPTRP